jgi:hypothetical protein
MKLTGTFLCGTEIDIPSNNWGEKEWAREFRIMHAIGIDTVILIHSGFLKHSTFPSDTLAECVQSRPVYTDMISLFLRLAEQEGMSFYPGTYVGAMWGYTPDNCDAIKDRELYINCKLIDEIWKKYGSSPAFAGWYNSFELNTAWRCCTDVVSKVGAHCKEISGNMPVILSPYYIPYCNYQSKNIPAPDGVTDEDANLQFHLKSWDEMLSELEGNIDVVAFQDGVKADLSSFLKDNTELIRKHGMHAWSNVETFSHDTSIKFPPVDWSELRWKLDSAGATPGMEKAITFEFSHFMSPYSFWHSGRNLFLRYCEYYGIDAEGLIEDIR